MPMVGAEAVCVALLRPVGVPVDAMHIHTRPMVAARCGSWRARMVSAHGIAAARAIRSHIEPLRLAQFVPVVHCADGGC